MRFLNEIMFIMKTIKSHFKGSHDKLNLTLLPLKCYVPGYNLEAKEFRGHTTIKTSWRCINAEKTSFQRSVLVEPQALEVWPSDTP